MNSIKSAAKAILWHCPRKFTHSVIYFWKHKKLMNWKNPALYDEMIHYLMATTYNESYGKYADKYQVREYVKNCGLGDLLIPLLGGGVYQSADDIDFSKLPEHYVLITNHASGSDFYFICDGTKEVDEEAVKLKLNKALKEKFSRRLCEYQYENIHPLILCEEFLSNTDHTEALLDDYKVVCVNGVPQKILVCTGRNEGRDYYSTKWEYLDHVKDAYKSHKLLPEPVCLSRMLEAAAILSKPFPLARIDFYVVNSRLYFGEITLTPSAGCHNNLNDRGQREWKDLVK